jgi:Flp pilus assembly pilin Flp
VTNLSIRIHSFISGLFHREEGQDLIEYALLGGLIAAGIIAVLTLFTGEVQNMIQGIGNCIDFENTTGCEAGF